MSHRDRSIANTRCEAKRIYHQRKHINRIEKDKKELEEENKQLKEKIENLTTLVVCGDTKQIKNTAQYKLEQLQQRIEEVLEDIKEYKEMGYSKYDENEIEIELIDKILEILGGENNR